jgi:hypothetical protein
VRDAADRLRERAVEEALQLERGEHELDEGGHAYARDREGIKVAHAEGAEPERQPDRPAPRLEQHVVGRGRQDVSCVGLEKFLRQHEAAEYEEQRNGGKAAEADAGRAVDDGGPG